MKHFMLLDIEVFSNIVCLCSFFEHLLPNFKWFKYYKTLNSPSLFLLAESVQ